MDERAKPSDSPEPGDAPAPDTGQPPIPDGGLGATMPDWLLRPPAWRGMAAREPERRALPQPDTSVIDPRTMLDLGDLPLWLQRIADRSVEPETAVTDDVEPGNGPSLEAPPELDPPETASAQAAGEAPERPATPRHVRAAPKIVLRPTSPGHLAAWWKSRMALAGLAMLLVFLIVWVVLVAT